jgi:hypothetical protein
MMVLNMKNLLLIPLLSFLTLKLKYVSSFNLPSTQQIPIASTESQTRRTFFVNSVLPNALVAAFSLTIDKKVANAVPLVGRFEALKGANSFIGSWKYEATKGISQGELVFLKNGEVELRSGSDDGSPTVIAVGAVPWKYVSPKGADTMVTVTFTLDEDGQDDVLIFQGLVDSAGGPDRVLEGKIATGRAEIGARGSGPMKQVGSFKATFLQ